MRLHLSVLVAGLAVAALVFNWRATSAFTSGSLPASIDEGKPQSFALVELFTSEGCSSCPPADRLLSQIADDARGSGRRIYALSFHVDYWNYIGWRDPYSDKRYSERQRRYARSFPAGRIYTPQMVVNGAVEFVGSNAGKAKRAISAALKQRAEAAVTIRNVNLEAGKLTLAYSVSNFSKTAVVNIALVERGLAQQVARGENSGKMLKHDNVVRAFEVRAAAAGEVLLAVQKEVDLAKSSVVVYVQNAKTMRVLGAAAREVGR